MTTFEMKVLKRNNAFMLTIIILLLGSIGGGIAAFNNHESRISANKETITGILDSGAEFIARKVVRVEVNNLRVETKELLNNKLDKNIGDIIIKTLDRIEDKIDKK